MVKKIFQKDIVVIGAGASGLMFASMCKNKNIAIIEANDKIAKKVLVSGGGKCNITNHYISIENFLGDIEFIKDVALDSSFRDVLNFFDELEFVKIKKNQYFCKSGADSVVKSLLKRVDKKGIYLKQKVLDVDFIDGKFYTYTQNSTFISKKLVVASGGVSYPQLGVSDIAYEIAKKFGHKVTKLKPALVGFTVQKDDFWMKNLSGISLPVKINVGEKTFYDDLLFTHRGISGPAVLNASLYWEKGSIEIDFLPKQKLFFKNKNRQISSNLPLAKRFIKEFLKKLDLKDKVVKDLTKSELEKLKLLKSYRLAPAGDFGYKKAEVTKGGIRVDEIDSKNMQSKLQKGLYFLGECLDITGELGGYNLHFAYAGAKKLCFNFS